MKIAIAAGAVLLSLASAAQAQTAPPTFDRAAYVTCREAQAMSVETRRSLAMMLAEQSARLRGVAIPADQRGGELAMLVRSGCTMAPEAYLYAVIDRAIIAEKDRLPRR